MASDALISVDLVYSPGPRVVRHYHLQVPLGSTIASLLRSNEALKDLSAEEVDALGIGIWGRKVTADQIVRDQDRIEIYRPLRVDPKTARRERFVRQGARTSGLFAKNRAGGKDGY